MAFFFYEVFAWLLLVIGLIVGIILFVSKQKWSPIMYMISILTYVFTVDYIIEAFALSKNWILLSLIFSTALMIYVGKHLSNSKR